MRGALAGMLVAACTACGHDAPPPPAAHDDAAPARPDAALELPALQLGLPTREAYAWRKRAGQVAFRAARKAEDHDDWARVVDACRDALAADPGHLEAAWLIAVAYGRLGRNADVLAPLTVAVSGDFGKWAPASLEQPALQAFLATPTGGAWRRRVEATRAEYAAAIARGLLVTAGAELFAVDVDPDPRGHGVVPRWYRLTRTYGAVIGAIAEPDPGPPRYLYYVTSRAHALQIGVVDVASGHSSRPQELGGAGPLTIGYGAGPVAPGAWIGVGPPRGPATRQLDADGFLHPLPPKSQRPRGAWLEVAGKSARLHRLPVADITADWDDRGLASAIRLARSNRVVTVPAGQIDGDTVVWSPDHTHVALVALGESCAPAPAAAAYVIDASTGTAHEIGTAKHGMAVAWTGDRQLAISGDDGVALVDLDGHAPIALDGADDLLARKRHPRCAGPDAGAGSGSGSADEPETPEPDETGTDDAAR